MSVQVLVGNSLEVLPALEKNSVHCSVTSPPYYGLRKYQGDQRCDWPEVEYSPMPGLPPIAVMPMTCALGHEPTIEAYVGHLVAIYREVWRVLRDDGVAWIVMGDSFANDSKWGGATGGKHVKTLHGNSGVGREKRHTGLKQGDLMLVPHRLALALQADRWLVRNDNVWAKVAPMPESVSGWRWERHRVKVKGAPAGTRNVDNRNRQGDPAHSGGYRSDVANNPTAKWIDCPGCPKCENNGGYVLKRGSWRHTRAHEFVLMCTKKMGYWANQEAVREALALPDATNGTRVFGGAAKHGANADHGERTEGRTYDNAPSGRNPRSVLSPSPEPFTGAKIVADYVGDDGKPYIASPDCPIHGRLADRQKWHRLGYDEQPGSQSNGSLDIGNYHEPKPSYGPFSKLLPDSRDDRHSKMDCQTLESVQRHNPESTGGDKSVIDHPDTILASGKSFRTNHIPVAHGHQADNLDSPPPEDVQIAIGHNNQNHKKAHAPETNLPCTASDKTAAHIVDKSELPLFDGLHLDIGENNTLGDLSEDAKGRCLSVRNDPRIVDKQNQASCASKDNYTCKCVVCQVDHFAVFPTGLIESLIKATCPDKCCPECGAGWSPVVKTIRVKHPHTPGKGGRQTVPGMETSPTSCFRTGLVPISDILGYRPTCGCGRDDHVPGVCLDPFFGAGTVGLMCDRLGLDCIGIDISESYAVELAAPRIREDAPLFADVAVREGI